METDLALTLFVTGEQMALYVMANMDEAAWKERIEAGREMSVVAAFQDLTHSTIAGSGKSGFVAVFERECDLIKCKLSWD